MRPTDHRPKFLPARKGFNLIEAAIVLGVVGLVIGAIWIAASSIQDKRHANAVKTVYILILNKARDFSASNTNIPISGLFAGAPFPDGFYAKVGGGWNAVTNDKLYLYPELRGKELWIYTEMYNSRSVDIFYCITLSEILLNQTYAAGGRITWFGSPSFVWNVGQSKPSATTYIDRCTNNIIEGVNAERILP